MTFYIYRNARRIALELNGAVELFDNEAAAIDSAVRQAQSAGSLYSMNYYRP